MTHMLYDYGAGDALAQATPDAEPGADDLLQRHRCSPQTQP